MAEGGRRMRPTEVGATNAATSAEGGSREVKMRWDGEARVRGTGRRKRRVVEKPQPESEWGWAVEDRLARLEDGQKWVLRLMVGGIMAGFIEALVRGLH